MELIDIIRLFLYAHQIYVRTIYKIDLLLHISLDYQQNINYSLLIFLYQIRNAPLSIPLTA